LKHKRPPDFRTRLAIAGQPVGKEHHPELAAHGIEAVVIEGQTQGIGLPPDNANVDRLALGRVIEHGLVEVAHHVSGSRTEPWRQRPGDDPAAGRRLQNRPGRRCGHPPGQIVGERLEDERHQIGVVDFRYRPGKDLVARRHSNPPSLPD
jgi:hypothetical protein